MQLPEQIIYLQDLLCRLAKANSALDKLSLLNQELPVKNFLNGVDATFPLGMQLNIESKLALWALLAIGQGVVVFRNFQTLENPKEHVKTLLQTLLQVENIYASIGGIIGYHLAILKLIIEKKSGFQGHPNNIRYIKPAGKNISELSPLVKEYVSCGIQSMPLMGEFYPVGGAGDRLGLLDEKTGKPLPAAKLKFAGRNLLEWLFRDLQAREFLYYRLTGQRLVTPVALMTSHEKNNHAHILEICEENQWFGRPKESLRFFIQPLVPVVTIEGNWSVPSPLELNLKPGGHGLLWKLALENGIFDWMESLKRRKILIRQINNPIAGIDLGLLAFIGIGCKENKSFGFASCERLLNAPEGMNTFIEKPFENGFEYRLTNIEYTDFENKGMHDIPENSASIFSIFPSNTNILFADIQEVRQAAEKYPIPGLLINMKNKVPSVNEEGEIAKIEGGRLESTMQNIADYLMQKYPAPLKPEEYETFKSYITYNSRRKTISVTKVLYEKNQDLLGTPQGCLFDLLENYLELFKDFCKFVMPSMGSKENYLKNGPPFYILLHPALGPPFYLIAQKIQRGRIHQGSELQLEIADLHVSNLDLNGTLRVICENIVGQRNADGNLHYSEETGKCILKDVRVKNDGIDRSTPQNYWSNQIRRKGELFIEISGNGEFFAENIDFTGNYHIKVPAERRIIAMQEGPNVKFCSEKIEGLSSFWQSTFAEQRINI